MAAIEIICVSIAAMATRGGRCIPRRSGEAASPTSELTWKWGSLCGLTPSHTLRGLSLTESPLLGYQLAHLL